MYTVVWKSEKNTKTGYEVRKRRKLKIRTK